MNHSKLERRKRLKKGIRLIDYLSNRPYFVSIPVDFNYEFKKCLLPPRAGDTVYFNDKEILDYGVSVFGCSESDDIIFM